MKKQRIGSVEHYFSKLGVAVIALRRPLKVGETLSIEGASTDFLQPVESMQLDGKKVVEAVAGNAVGLKVRERARIGDSVYRAIA